MSFPKAPLPGGVGAYNANSDLIVVVDALPRVPDAFRAQGDVIALLAGGEVVHEATYGTLVSEVATSTGRVVVLLEVNGDGEPLRSTTLKRAAE